jgi:hypothetical protein
MMAPFGFAFDRWRRYGAVRLRRVHFLLKKEGKRFRRLYREEGLQVCKRRQSGSGLRAPLALSSRPIEH